MQLLAVNPPLSCLFRLVLFDDSGGIFICFMAEGDSRDWERNEELDREQFWSMLSQQEASCRMWFLAGYLRGQADRAQLDCSADPLADYPFMSDTIF